MGFDGFNFAEALVAVPAGKASVLTPLRAAAPASNFDGFTDFLVILSICSKSEFPFDST